VTLPVSCSRPPTETAKEVRPADAVRAFLFDAELRRAGKPTSFRLEIFQTDSAMALSGRGYLGKGALRGRATADSLLCYFPSTNEYIDEPVLNLMHALECEIAPKGINLVTLLDRLPDSTSLDPTIKLVSNYQDGKRPSFIVYVENCPWQMELTYRQESIASYRLDEFFFFDGKETRLKATCREYKQSATVKPDRFEVRIPPDAQRIIP
jgi:hypothetical protein